MLVPAASLLYGYLYEALITLTYVAAKTECLRLGVSVLVLPQRQAILAAKQLVTVNDFSRGRVIVEVGVGWLQGEFDNLGAGFRRCGQHTDEALRVFKIL